MHRKPHLPEKICLVCHKPFAWRKKWARDWEQVKYCSERCRRQRNVRDNRNNHPLSDDPTP